MTHARKLSAMLLLAPMVAACSSEPAPSRVERTTERERDSTIGASRLPGAQGVQGAIRVADSSAVRRAREDSMSGGATH